MRPLAFTFAVLALFGLGLAQLDVSPDGSCGAAVQYSCLGSSYGNCCSSKGKCGGTNTDCGSGCQSNFGLCGRGVGGLTSDTGGSEPTTSRTTTTRLTALPSTLTTRRTSLPTSNVPPP